MIILMLLSVRLRISRGLKRGDEPEKGRRQKEKHTLYSWCLILLLLSVSGIIGGLFFLSESYPRPDELKTSKSDRIMGLVKQIRRKEGSAQVTLKAAGLRGSLLVNLSIVNEEDLLPGDQVEVRGQISLLKAAGNPGEFDAQKYYLAQGVRLQMEGESWQLICRPAWSVAGAAYRLRLRIAGVYRKALTSEEAALLTAVVLGDKTGLSEDQRTVYQQNGLAHLLAVSGLHVSILGGSLYLFMRKRGFRYLTSCLTGSLLLCFYGCMTGFGSSAARAIIMYLVYLMAQFLGADYDMVSAMSLSGILLLLEYPLKLFDGGFQISFLSILALGLVLPWAKEFMEAHRESGAGEAQDRDRDRGRGRFGKYFKKMREALFAGIIISGVTAPALMAVYYEWAPAGILLNLIFLPLMEPLMLSAVCGGLAGLLLFKAGALLLLPARLILSLFDGIFAIVKCLPVHTITTGCPAIWQLIIMYLLEAGLFFLWYGRPGVIHRVLLLSLLALVIIPDRGASISLPASLAAGPDNMTIHMLDVGQGESILIRTPDRKCILIDGGSTSRSGVGQYVIIPALKYLGVKRLDYVIATHMDEDHISGLEELFEKDFPISCLLLPDAGRDDPAWQAFSGRAKNAGIHVNEINRGDEIRFAGLVCSCLHPVSGYDPSDRNDTSVVLYLSYRDFDMLFTGDLGEEGEEMLTRSMRVRQGLDVLKVAHHGSKYSSRESFLSLFPGLETAMISAGKGNRYGHPHEELLKRLRDRGISIYVTKESGALCLRTDGYEYDITGYNQ
ncbi:MAG: DNA internalization-related competence protein ComEC/Rec2 [Eubacterium sp.]|nr:DNA internalization-related competence protein ComEC/Rec2 [Eubacterium sp.]